MNREARILKARRKELGLSQTDVGFMPVYRFSSIRNLNTDSVSFQIPVWYWDSVYVQYLNLIHMSLLLKVILTG